MRRPLVVVAHSQPSPYKAEYVLGECPMYCERHIDLALPQRQLNIPSRAHSDIWTTALGAARV
ncbi:hypothetical protein A0H81_13118 [Grifola frondosa]|uniref:Uncharacterized protein n=1 Tax=Grifola frondosa TaxID=5627 RepID=A0A1C7LSM4_GRIFR|nr:hypothetical protein A0H81_13118 [Grifola frondosa]